MQSFLDVTLPRFISMNLSVSSKFDTKILQTQSGKEYRYQFHAPIQFKYKLLYVKLSYEQFEEFNQFFITCKGKQYSFKMLDPKDHSIDNQILAVGPSEESEFAVYKYYYIGETHKKRIMKIIPNSSLVQLNEREVDYNIDYDRAIIILSNPLEENDILQISLKYEIVARFNCDSFEYNYEPDGTISIKNLEIIEVL